MNYLTFIKNTQHRLAVPQEPLQFLISGNDPYLRESLLYDVLKQCRERNERVLIIDDAGESIASDILSSLGYSIKNGLSGYKLYDIPFKINRLTGLSTLRQILDLVDYDERRKGKLTAYLNFIRQIEMLETGQNELTISLPLLGKYSTIEAVNTHLEKLVANSIIDEEQQLFLLAKFSECASAAPELEDMLFLIAPFVEGRELWSESPTTAFVFPLDKFGEDKTLKKLILKLLSLGLTEKRKSNPKATVIILDKAYGDRSGILNFILSTSAKLNIFSEDIFTLGSASDLANIFNRFNVRVFGRHAVTSSAQQIEEFCGVIEVTKSSYTVAYDRRWRANKPWDILTGRNKTETYTQTPPTLEPKYRKESIMNLPPNCAILAYRGETTIFSI